MKSRLNAFGVHLLVSALLVSIFASLVFFVWYTPSSILNLQGGSKILLIMATVDVILGPIFTFLVFKPEKSRRMLIADMSIIVIFQLMAFAYGGWTIYSERPAFYALFAGTFQVIKVSEIDMDAALKSLPETDTERRWVYVDASDSAVIDNMLKGTSSIESQFKYYRLLSTVDAKTIAIKATPLEKITFKKQVNDWLQAHQLTADKILLFSLNARERKAVVVLSADTALPLGVVTE
jgi:hypothetical protein